MQSEQTNELAAALAKAQAAMKPAKFNKINPHFKNKYADLSAIIEAVREPLASNGLSITQETEYTIDWFALRTTLHHTSGQWVASIYPLPLNATPQQIGSALTYAKRYSLSSICCISADEDDDAEAASKGDVVGGVIGPHQLKELEQLVAKSGANPQAFARYMQVSNLGDLPVHKFSEAKQALLEKMKAA